jgi:hypothetical protein
MTEDPVERIFRELDDYYPGSKRRRRDPNPVVVERIAKRAASEGWDSRPILKTLPNGREVELFSAGSMSAALGRPLVTLRLWERRGYIPRAPYRLKSMVVDGVKKPGWRMYSRDIVESTIESFQSRGLLEAKRIDWDRQQDLTVELVENWRRIHEQEIH